jgi:hypothetical protein
MQRHIERVAGGKSRERGTTVRSAGNQKMCTDNCFAKLRLLLEGTF